MLHDLLLDSPPNPAEGWWEQAFPPRPREWKPPGEKVMLYLVAYDVSNPKRLSKVAKLLEDFGTRVQYSLFECRLEPDAFHMLWEELVGLLDETEDRLVAYCLDQKNARKTLTAGRMVCSRTHVCYLI